MAIWAGWLLPCNRSTSNMIVERETDAEADFDFMDMVW